MPRRVSPPVRFAAIASAAIGSILLGIALVWVFAPLAFRGLRTWELVGLLGLLALPLLTAWAARAECKSRRHVPVRPAR